MAYLSHRQMHKRQIMHNRLPDPNHNNLPSPSHNMTSRQNAAFHPSAFQHRIRRKVLFLPKQLPNALRVLLRSRIFINKIRLTARYVLLRE